MVYTWALVGAVCAVIIESSYLRTGLFWEISWYTFPLQIGVSYCIYQVLVGSGDLISTFMVFSLATTALRVSSVLWLGQSPGWRTWVALGVILGANIFKSGKVI